MRADINLFIRDLLRVLLRKLSYAIDSVPCPDLARERFHSPTVYLLSGWCSHPWSRLELRLFVNEIEICKITPQMWRPDLLSHFPLSLRSLFSGFELRFTPSGMEKLAGAELKIEFLANDKVKKASTIKLSGQKQEQISKLEEGLDFHVTDGIRKKFRGIKKLHLAKSRLFLPILENIKYLKGRVKAGFINTIPRGIFSKRAAIPNKKFTS